MLGEGEIVNSFQTDSLIRISNLWSWFSSVGIISADNVFNIHKELKKQVKLAEKKNLN